MSGAKKGTWIALTVFGAVVIMVASWFLAISPTLGTASELRTEAQDTRDQNEVLAQRVDQLRADFEKLDEYKAELAALRFQIPTSEQLSDYLRQLDAVAAAHATTVVAISPGVPQAVVVPAVAVPAPAPTATPATESSEEPDTSADGAASLEETPAPDTPVVSPVPEGLAAIPLVVTVVGTYDNTMAFLNDIQKATPRLFLVSGITVTGQDEADANGGRPETVLGDQEMSITGLIYVLPEASTAATPGPEPTVPPALPAPVPGKNPLVPLGGGR